MASAKEWDEVLAVSKYLNSTYPGDVVAIGGVAIALRTQKSALAKDLPLEFTHDAERRRAPC